MRQKAVFMETNHKCIEPPAYSIIGKWLFFRACRYLCHQVPDRFTAFSIFLVQNANIGELFPQKNQELEIFKFTKVMAKKVKNFRSFFEKVAMV
jgi:hypothetical protein